LTVQKHYQLRPIRITSMVYADRNDSIPLKFLIISFLGAAFVRKFPDSSLELEAFPFEGVVTGVTNPSLTFAGEWPESVC
jgi:hypothetical protein